MPQTYRNVRPFFHDRTSRLRVIWITSEYFPRVGGLEKLVAALVSGLSERAEVGLVTALHQRPVEGEKVRHLAALNLQNCATTSELDEVRATLRQVCADFRPDAIHLASGGLACFARDLVDLAPVFCTVHCKDVTAPWQKIPGADVRTAVAAGLSLCSTVFCVSDYTRGHVLRLAPDACATTMTPGLAVALAASARVVRSIYATPPAAVPRVVTVGRIVDRKGHALLLDALEAIDVPFFWDIVGTGPLEAGLRARIGGSAIADRVRFHGALSDDDLSLLLDRCDIFALTPFEIQSDGQIDAEGFGLVYLEAALHGKPSVGSRAGGCREAIADGLTGYTVDPHDRTALRDAIARLLRDRPLRRSMGLAAFERLDRDFRIERRVDDLMRCYRSAAVSLRSGSA